MKFFVLFCVLVFVQQCASFQMHKVGHPDSPHGSALKMIDDIHGEYRFFDPAKDIFSLPAGAFSICTAAKKCCNVDQLYAAEPEHAALSALKHNYQHGIDAWILRYYLCASLRRPLATQEDIHAAHAFVTETGESYTRMRDFLTWFKNVHIK